MYGYEIPVTESAYSAKERYLNDKKLAENAVQTKKQYVEFISNSRDYFLAEAMNMILQNSLSESTTTSEREYGKALVEGFVKENNSIKLLSEFASKTLFLANISELVRESHQKVVHSCKEGDCNSFRITQTINSDFFEKLIGLNDEKITKKINEKVCNALEDYVQANVNDKLDLEELAEKTKEKIDNIKAKNAEERDKIVKEFTYQYQKEVNAIKQRTNRKVGLFEQIMHSMTRSIVSEQTILESYTNESGKLDVDKIKGKVTVLYSFLEMLNTTKMVNMNEAYVEKVINSIEK